MTILTQEFGDTSNRARSFWSNKFSVEPGKGTKNP